MDSTRHTCLRLELSGDEDTDAIFIKGTWFSSHFSLSITDGLNAWVCNASENEVEERADQWDQPVPEYIQTAERYLGFRQPGSDYSFLDAGSGPKRELNTTLYSLSSSPIVLKIRDGKKQQIQHSMRLLWQQLWIQKIFSNAALDLGNELVKKNINLVYGGGSIGLMGLVSKRVYDGGCHVLGVIPTALMTVEVSGYSVGEVKVVSDMHERKTEMVRRSDAFVALPGGYGTMEELLEVITWVQLGIHEKPVGLLNVEGYYDSLLELFDNGVKEGFIQPAA